MKGHGENGEDDNEDDDEGKIVFDKWDVSEEITGKGE